MTIRGFIPRPLDCAFHRGGELDNATEFLIAHEKIDDAPDAI